MGKDFIDRCRREDIPAVVGLHRKVYGAAGGASSEHLESHYNTVLFENPWCDGEIPSLVFRNENGDVEGLLGVLVYRMKFKGKPIRMAVPHSFMVAPGCRSPMAAMQMIRTFFDGPQDLVVGDGANDQARKVLEAMGGRTSHLYSMHWLCLLRPCSYVANAMGKKRGMKLLAGVSKPVYSLLDAFAHRIGSHASISNDARNFTSKKIDDSELLSCIDGFVRKSPLYPEYSQSDIQWFWHHLQSNTRRGRSQAFEVLDAKGKRVGAFLYYLREGKYMEIVFLRAREDCVAAVFDHVMDYAFRHGAVSVEGRMEQRFIQSISQHNCLTKHRRWVVTYSRDPEIVHVLNRGDAMLSPMEGELWVHELSDNLHS